MRGKKQLKYARLTEHIKRQAMHVISYTEARNSFKAVIERVVNDHDVTLIHRRDGDDAVILSAELYSSMRETLHLLSDPANAKVLMASVEQHNAGKAKARKLI